jgi:hypothetical protein
MNRHPVLLAAIATAVAIQAQLNAGVRPPLPPPNLHAATERYHYRISARIRPFVLFWINRSNVGDAVATRGREPEGASYSLLIGSDPDRTPLHINRWGYIEEETHGAESRLVGLMTESDEDSIEQAEANVRRQSGGRHPFKMIQATADHEQSISRVTSISAPEDYTFRQLRLVLDLGLQDCDWKPRTVRLPPGARPGFLTALAETMHTNSADPITYVYYGRLYELRRTHVTTIPNLQLGPMATIPAIAADFLVTNSFTGERTRFSMTYGVQPPFAEVPLRVMYQPRWWMQVELTIDNTPEAPQLTDGAHR